MSVHMNHQIGLVPVPASGPGTVIAVSQLSLSLTFMLLDGFLGNCLDRSVNVRWVFNRYWFFFHSLSLTFTFVTLTVSSSTQRSFKPNESSTEMAGKAIAGVWTCERLTMTFDKQHCQHITISRVVEKECDRRCKWEALLNQCCVTMVWCYCRAANSHFLSGLYCEFSMLQVFTYMNANYYELSSSKNYLIWSCFM